MSYRLTKIYTRTGDDGCTHLGDGKRISKNHARIEALGTLDELNSFIGLILAYPLQNEEIRQCLTQVQHDLFDLGGELCPTHRPAITAEKITLLEKMIDQWNATLPPLKEFILPGGNITSATCHVARATCRRAERCLVTLHQEENIAPLVLSYINRLSDLLFVAARILMRETTTEETLWQHERKPK